MGTKIFDRVVGINVEGITLDRVGLNKEAIRNFRYLSRLQVNDWRTKATASSNVTAIVKEVPECRLESLKINQTESKGVVYNGLTVVKLNRLACCSVAPSSDER